MKPASTRPGEGSFDETAEPKAKGKGKTKGMAIAKVQASSSSSSADPPDTQSTGSGGTGGVGELDADSIKAVKEVHDLLRSMRAARVQADTSLEGCPSGESIRQAFESIRKVALGEIGLLDGGATACMRTAKVHERNLKRPAVKVSLAVGETVRWGYLTLKSLTRRTGRWRLIPPLVAHTPHGKWQKISLSSIRP